LISYPFLEELKVIAFFWFIKQEMVLNYFFKPKLKHRYLQRRTDIILYQPNDIRILKKQWIPLGKRLMEFTYSYNSMEEQKLHFCSMKRIGLAYLPRLGKLIRVVHKSQLFRIYMTTLYMW